MVTRLCWEGLAGTCLPANTYTTRFYMIRMRSTWRCIPKLVFSLWILDIWDPHNLAFLNLTFFSTLHLILIMWHLKLTHFLFCLSCIIPIFWCLAEKSSSEKPSWGSQMPRWLLDSQKYFGLSIYPSTFFTVSCCCCCCWVILAGPPTPPIASVPTLVSFLLTKMLTGSCWVHPWTLQ
jgi:hypothetical protein